MVFKGSRYTSTNVITPDYGKGGHQILEQREIPSVTPAITWTVADGDRLDQLSNRFYSDPKKYWLILDANPSVLNPFDLLKGGAPISVPRNRIVS